MCSGLCLDSNVSCVCLDCTVFVGFVSTVFCGVFVSTVLFVGGLFGLYIVWCVCLDCTLCGVFV